MTPTPSPAHSSALVPSLGALLCLVSIAACAPPEAPTTEDLLLELRALPVSAAFDRVADEAAVPRELLLALAWHQSSFEPLGQDAVEPDASEAGPGDSGFTDAPEHPPLHGWLGLNEWQLDAAAGLSGLDPALVREDAHAGLWAGGLLLATLADRDAEPLLPGAAWWPAVTALADFDDDWMNDEFALDVFTTIQEGLEVTLSDGDVVAFVGRDLPDLEDIEPQEGPYEEDGDFSTGGDGFPGRARYLPAHSSNQSGARSSHIRRIVLHTIEGSYQGAIGWFRNSSANVSAHYVVRRSDGQVTQMVRDSNIAWHVCGGNSDSIGIEHEGRASVASTWTDAQVESSARLTGWLARKYDIPVDRQHIVGHGEVQGPGCSYRYDPGPHFPWSRYMARVRYYKKNGWRASNAPKAKLDIQLPKNGQQVGNPFVVRVKSKRSHHKSIYLGARRVKRNLRANPGHSRIEPRSNGWKRVRVQSYTRSGVANGRKTIRVRVRPSTVDVDPHRRKIHRLDYALWPELSDDVHHVRYWLNGRPVRDKQTNRLWARGDDYELVKRFGAPGRHFLLARAYRSDGRLVGEGWRHIKVNREPGPPARISQIGADELWGSRMWLHADAMPAVEKIAWYVDGQRVNNVDNGNQFGWPHAYGMYVDFDVPGAHELEARAFDAAGNRRHTRRSTLHAPSPVLEVAWARLSARHYRFDADAPAGTDHVVFFVDGQPLVDDQTGDAYATGRAFEFEYTFDNNGPTWVEGEAVDAVGNVLGTVGFIVDVQ